MNYDQIETIINTLKSIEGSLGQIAESLQEANKPKGLGNPRYCDHGITDCISKKDISFPTPWNTDSKPKCESDYIPNNNNSNLY